MIFILENHPDKDRLEGRLDPRIVQGFTYPFIQGKGESCTKNFGGARR